MNLYVIVIIRGGRPFGYLKPGEEPFPPTIYASTARKFSTAADAVCFWEDLVKTERAPEDCGGRIFTYDPSRVPSVFPAGAEPLSPPRKKEARA